MTKSQMADEIPAVEFDQILERLIAKNPKRIFLIPDVYELVSEEMAPEVYDAWVKNQK